MNAHLSNAIHLVNGYNGLEVKDIIVSSVAAANVVTPEMEKKIGALVLDIGAGVDRLRALPRRPHRQNRRRFPSAATI